MPLRPEVSIKDAAVSAKGRRQHPITCHGLSIYTYTYFLVKQIF